MLQIKIPFVKVKATIIPNKQQEKRIPCQGRPPWGEEQHLHPVPRKQIKDYIFLHTFPISWTKYNTPIDKPKQKKQTSGASSTTGSRDSGAAKALKEGRDDEVGSDKDLNFTGRGQQGTTEGDGERSGIGLEVVRRRRWGGQQERDETAMAMAMAWSSDPTKSLPLCKLHIYIQPQ